MPAPLPFEIVRSVLQGPPITGALVLARVVGKLLTVRPGDRAQSVLTLAVMAAGKGVDTATAREVELAVDGLSPAAAGLAAHLSAALQTSVDDLQAVQQGLLRLRDALQDAIGAAVPPATVLDATVLETARTIGAVWGPEALVAGQRDRAEELARRVCGAVRIGIELKNGLEPPAKSAERLRALDAAAEQTRRRVSAIESRLRASLPEP